MDNDELIDRLNALQAQNIALMHLMAGLVRQSGANVRAEYRARCAIFMRVTEPEIDEDAQATQRAAFDRVERTVLGERDAPPSE